MSVTRRQFLGTSALAIAAPAIVRLPVFGRAQQVPATSFEELRGGVGIFNGRGGTIGWLVTPDGAIVIDSQYPDTGQLCADGLKQRSPRGIQLLINTHHHGDHVGGNPAFRPLVSKIVQQEKCAALHKATTEKDGTAAQQAFADVTFGESWSTSIANEQVQAKYYGPGHTGGDAIVVFEKANIVHMGDLMFHHRHPFIDRPNGASIVNWSKALDRIAGEHKDATFIFGHAKAGMPVTGTRTDLLLFRDYLRAVVDLAQQGIKAGKSRDEIIKAESLGGFEDYAGAPPRLSLGASLGVAYDELTTK